MTTTYQNSIKIKILLKERIGKKTMVKFFRGNNIKTLTKDLYNNPTVIYGTSYGAIRIYKELVLNNVEVVVFTNSDANLPEDVSDQFFLNKRIISLSELREHRDDFNVVIGTKQLRFIRQINEILNNLGIINIFVYHSVYGAGEYNIEEMKSKIERSSAKISRLYKSLADEESKRVFQNLLDYRASNDLSLIERSYEMRHKQYFPVASDKILCFNEEEVFVDAGAYDGGTTLDFIEYVQNKCKHIYSFEPDSLMYAILKETVKVKGLDNVTTYPYGLFNKKSLIGFSQLPDNGSSCIDESESANTIETVSLDELLYKEAMKITYIKMDIEGAEREALDGASGIIKRDHPKLAISIYHKDDDLWELPYKILTDYEGYKLYIRHYTDITTETICYAVPISEEDYGE